tara:strand:+ start:4072 stop:4677 length:606 start_codon:yes stop_codon:yes gene_type:complete
MISVGLVDYGIGNVRSLRKSLLKLEYDAIVSNEVNVLAEKDILILPGVGQFSFAMNSLKKYYLDEFIINYTKNKPIIGICLGMQLLTDSSIELVKSKGLGLIPGNIIQLPNKKHHIGWNTISVTNNNSFLKQFEKCQFYFNHGYYFNGNEKYSQSKSSFGEEFTSIIKKDNVIGFQFHPEKSQVHGLRLISKTINYLIKEY